MEEIWGIHAIPTPNALAGSNFLYEHPEARAEDLMWAMAEIDCNCVTFKIMEPGVVGM